MLIYMVLGYVSSKNVWMNSVQDDVTHISDAIPTADALVAAQIINNDTVTWC